MQDLELARRVVRLQRCELIATDRPWPFALEHAASIEQHWRKRKSENPIFFDGRIRMLADHTCTGDVLGGSLLETGFKEFLYWRESGEPEAGVRDAFASAVIRTADGGVLLGRQRPGNINTGLSYLPGGFIDANDVDAGGRIDIAASSWREVREETGLGDDVLTQQPGFLATFSGMQLSIGVEYLCQLDAAGVLDRVTAHLAADPKSELAEVVIVHRLRDLDGLAMPAFARLLLQEVLA